MTEKIPNTETMGERQQVQYVEYGEEAGINFGEYVAILRPNLLKILGLSLTVGVATLLYMFTKPNLYRAAAVITPAAEEKQNPALGALASFGISVGGPTKVEDLEALFKSNDLTVRVFERHKPWPFLLGDRYDPATATVRPSGLGALIASQGDSRPLGDWDAIRAASGSMAVSANRRSGSLTLSFESLSPEGSALVLRHYLEEAKNRLQEEALDRAIKNKKFIEEQIGRTVDALTRERLYALLGQEVEREMMARNREQFGFRVVDFPRVPDRKAGPARRRVTQISIIFSFLAMNIGVLVWNKVGTKGRLERFSPEGREAK